VEKKKKEKRKAKAKTPWSKPTIQVKEKPKYFHPDLGGCDWLPWKKQTYHITKGWKTTCRESEVWWGKGGRAEEKREGKEKDRKEIDCTERR
jgi:hypothetical protein